MLIRDAKPEDAAQIARYWNPQIRDTAVTFASELKSPEELAQTITARHEAGRGFLVAAEGDKILGHATYFPFRGGSGYARTMEHTVILDPDHTGQGIGQMLMLRLQDHARAAGIHAMIASVSSENPRAVAFHERIGFRHVATLPEVGRKFGRWMDMVVLQKLL